MVITPSIVQPPGYGMREPDVTGSQTAGLSGGSFTGALARAAGENVGSYAINLGTLSAGGREHLWLPVTSANLTPTPEPVVNTPTAGPSKVYRASETTLTFANDAELSAGNVTGAL